VHTAHEALFIAPTITLFMLNNKLLLVPHAELFAQVLLIADPIVAQSVGYVAGDIVSLTVLLSNWTFGRPGAWGAGVQHVITTTSALHKLFMSPIFSPSQPTHLTVHVLQPAVLMSFIFAQSLLLHRNYSHPRLH
jgi:hypothetical protein